MNRILNVLNRFSFKAQTTALMWIIGIGFCITTSVGLLALVALKSEFDTNSRQNANIHTLILLSKNLSDNLSKPLELESMWQEYKNLHNLYDKSTLVSHIRQTYVKAFEPSYYTRIHELIDTEQSIMDAIDRAFKANNHAELLALFESQILLSFEIALYGEKITNSLYSITFAILSIFMLIVIGTIIILALTIRQSINTNHLITEELVIEKTKELQILNANLQKSIDYEVEQSRKKDLIMYQQARLASMGEMIQNIAHQWRQPLNSLTMLIQSFKSKAAQDKLESSFVLEQTQYGMKIATEMSNTIENFRNFFRPEVDTEHFELEVSINNCLEMIKEQIKDNHISVLLNIKKPHITINSYQNSFSQVVLILINNAIDAIKHKKELKPNLANPSIEISLDKIGYNIIFAVRDNGGGVSFEDTSKIFEPYFTTKHKAVGTGIGLYMAKQIIERHLNGSISVYNAKWGEDKDGKECYGAEFSIIIPTKDSSKALDSATSPKKQADSKSAESKRKTLDSKPKKPTTSTKDKK